MPFKIDTITAFVATDELGEDGIMAAQLVPGQWFPLVCADEKRLAMMYPVAVEMSELANRSFRVLQFAVQFDITEDVKKKYGK